MATSNGNGNTDPDPGNLELELPILGYWKIRGLVQPVRFLLAYLETEYKETWYELGPDLNKDSWLREKFELGLDLPNLPFWIDGDIKLTQSRAILRHLSREKDPDLLGVTAEDQRRVDMLENHLWDFWMALITLCYRYSDEERLGFLTTLPQQLQMICDFIGDRKWSISDNLTYVDFMLYEAVYQHKVFAPFCLNGFPKLIDILNNFEALPLISEYIASDKYIHAPMYTKLAKYYI